MTEENFEKEALKSMKEFELAWEEFFKDKPKPKNDGEEKKQMEEFFHWYNYERKQSDSGKTPAQMYKEIYGKEPIHPIKEESRMFNLELDREYEEEFEEVLDIAEEEAVVVAEEIFNENWKKIKQETEKTNKKEACKYSFILGFLNYMKMMNEKSRIIEEQMKDMPKEDIQKIVNKLKKGIEVAENDFGE